MGINFYNAALQDETHSDRCPNIVFSPVSITFAMELAANIIDPADAPGLQNRSASDRSMISPIDRILLPNALYFIGDLRFKFKRADTRKAVFRSENSTLGEVMTSFTAETLDSIAQCRAYWSI